MYLIVGLGNPTKKYDHTRHNTGFDCLDRIAERLSVKINRISCKAHIGKGYIGKEKVILAKPQTYMNLSGQSVGALLYYYKIPVDHLIVIYDDLDLEPGKIRIRKSGSAGGHNGMKDIIKMTGTQDFIRIRVGIGHPGTDGDTIDYVLGRPEGKEKESLLQAEERAAEAAIDIVESGADHAMNHYNG